MLVFRRKTCRENLPRKPFLPGRSRCSSIFYKPENGNGLIYMTQIARLIGGAGTGKTTELLQIMEGALDHFGGDPLMLGFASFTRAARAEAVTRAAAAWEVSEDLLSNKGWFRTVHSTVYRCLGIQSGELLTNSKGDIEWISDALGVKVSTEIDETGNNKFVGDPVVAAALNCWSLAKATLSPLTEVVRAMRAIDDAIPEFGSVVRVSERYESAKRMEGRSDFSDILMRFAGIGMMPREGIFEKRPEGELPEVGAWLFDEQQDASPLLDAVCRRLITAPTVRWAYVVGDPFQAIYGFAGSSAKCFMSWEVGKERTMPKSWRCPKPIAELGEACLRRMHAGYFDRKIAPADHDGSVTRCQDITDVTSQLDPRDSWLLIARTNHQASRLMASLYETGKPARWTNGQEGPTNKSLGMAALYALEQGKPISGRDWAKAVPLLPTNGKVAGESKTEKMLTRGTKTKWKNAEAADHWDVIFPDELEQVGATPELVGRLKNGSWVGLVDDAQGWRKQAERWGSELATDPKVRVGTIHSVKGAEADNVALLTTTSKRVFDGSAASPHQYDEECRIAYVGVTRARRSLTIIDEPRAHFFMEV